MTQFLRFNFGKHLSISVAMLGISLLGASISSGQTTDLQSPEIAPPANEVTTTDGLWSRSQRLLEGIVNQSSERRQGADQTDPLSPESISVTLGRLRQLVAAARTQGSVNPPANATRSDSEVDLAVSINVSQMPPIEDGSGSKDQDVRTGKRPEENPEESSAGEIMGGPVRVEGGANAEILAEMAEHIQGMSDLLEKLRRQTHRE